MRLRAELVGDDEIRGQLLADLDQMATMGYAALSHLRGRERQGDADGREGSD